MLKKFTLHNFFHTRWQRSKTENVRSLQRFLDICPRTDGTAAFYSVSVNLRLRGRSRTLQNLYPERTKIFSSDQRKDSTLGYWFINFKIKDHFETNTKQTNPSSRIACLHILLFFLFFCVHLSSMSFKCSEANGREMGDDYAMGEWPYVLREEIDSGPNNAVTWRKQTNVLESFPPTVGIWMFYFFFIYQLFYREFLPVLKLNIVIISCQNNQEIHAQSQTGLLTKKALLWNILQHICTVHVKSTCSLFGRPYTIGANCNKIQRIYNLRKAVHDV